MAYVYAIILGVVQGITEFVPISSSGHLVLLHAIITLPIQSTLIFDVALHFGTLFAIVSYFAKDIMTYMRTNRRLLWFFALSALPGGLVGVIWQDVIDQTLRSTWIVVFMLIVVSIIFFLVEKYAKQRRSLETIRWWEVVLIGCAQAVALIPGTSRSGATISAAMALGLDRVSAARFSFIMAIPIIAGASAVEALKLADESLRGSEYGLIGLGAAMAAGVGWIVIRYLLRFFQKYSLRAFAWYRLALALVVILVILL